VCAVRRPDHLLAALRHPGFGRLLTVRLAGQFGDGLFQASLAGTVLFNPERQARPADIAAGFAVLLLPYSLIGPFAGTLLDRWSRQRVLNRTNAVRAAAVLGVAAEIAAGTSGLAFYASALVVISLGRFVLSALSAALPHVVGGPGLVTANALSATAGTVCTALGGAAAIGVRAALGDGDTDYAWLATTAVLPYLLAAAVARRFAPGALGPTEDERRRRTTAGQVLRDLRAGAADVRSTPPVAAALLTVAVHRVCFGLWTVAMLLLYRNWLPDGQVFRAGLPGLGQLLAAVAVGGALAALVTPAAFRRVGPVRWVTVMLLASAVVEAGLGLPFRSPLLVLSALLLGFAAQAVKISVDTVVQLNTPDDYRGRVFALYDMLFNLALVVAAVLTALALPADGHSVAAVAAVAAGWLLAGTAYAAADRRVAAA
jgi:MFS family permease